MSASESTPQKTTPLGDYGSSHNPPPPQGDQHNRGISFGSNPPNNYYNSHASQHVTTSVMRAVIPMTANSNVVPGSPWSRNAVLHSSSHNSPTPHDIGGTRTSSHSATGRVDLSPHAFSMPGSIGHASPTFRHHGMATSDVHSFVPMMANPDTVSYGPLQSVPDRYNSGDARSWAGMVYPPHGTSMAPGSIGHASPTSRHHGMATSDMHSFVPMMANPDAASVPSTPDNLRTAVSYGPSQSVPYSHGLHDLGVMNPKFHLQLTRQSELPITRPPSHLRVCKWVHNNACCGYEGTLEDLNQHWNDIHLPLCPGAVIKCKWENCRYRNRNRNKDSIRVMWRSSMWRHISEVHLRCRRH